MIVDYTTSPGGADGTPRPLLDVSIGNLELTRVKCLVDSGAVNSLVPGWAAGIAGVDLNGRPERRFGVGGNTTIARFATVRLSAADFTWEADVGFCEPWPYEWGLLGYESFFRWFTVAFRGADLQFEVEPIAE